jgi:DNA polymerase sigma
MSDPPRKSLVDYSKVADRPAQDARFAAQQRPTASQPPPSAQMDAVMRLMTGREERTIAEKLADANRPTWEQYKKDNHDKLNLDETNEQEMELYRRKLDEQRDRLLARKSIKPKKKKKKRKRRKEDESTDESTSEDSSESSGDQKKHKKKQKRKLKKRKHKHRDSSSSDSESEDSSRKHRKKHHRHKSKSNESDDNHYKLSQFFSEGTENNS